MCFANWGWAYCTLMTPYLLPTRNHIERKLIVTCFLRPGYMVTRSADKALSSPASQLQHELQDAAVAQTPSSRKRKDRTSTDKTNLKPPSVTPTRSVGRPRKSQKVNFANLQPSRPLRRTTSGVFNRDLNSESNEPTNPATHHTRNRKENIPPVPPLPTTFPTTTVDIQALIRMRSKSSRGTDFGHNPEDALNLRKTYPMLTDIEASKYLGILPTDGKITDYTSTSHQNEPPSPALGRPVPPAKELGFKPSISRGSLRSSQKEPNVPNNSPASGLETYGTRGRAKSGKFVKLTALSPHSQEEAKDSVAELSPSKIGKGEKDLPPYPKNGEGEREKGEEGEEKEKEEFDWDEDVF